VEETIQFKLNGTPVSFAVDGDRKLLWVLRADRGLTGTKYGCGKGVCGACTVLVDNEPVRSCVHTVRAVQGKEVLTIEGLARNGSLHPLQKAFIEHHAFQCGFCTPGMILRAYGLLLKNPQPTPSDIVNGMDGNLCRCATYARIIRAIQSAAVEMQGGKTK
jgi:aerobic-type carbon monoxide dehydrogenase small subunit (CoxS/CutS family)